MSATLRERFDSWGETLSASRSAPTRLTLLALLFAWENMLHQLSFPLWVVEVRPLGWSLFVVSAMLAVLPSSMVLFALLIALRVIYTIDWTPMIRGHLFFAGLVSLGVAIALVSSSFERRKLRGFTADEREELFDRMAPFLRWSSLVIYAAVTLSKLNWDFIDPDKSAAAQFVVWTASEHPWIPTGPVARELAVWGTLAVEGGVPILLCFRKTRWLALVAALVFHTILGLTPLRIASFTLLMWVVLFPWIPRTAPRVWFSGFHRIVARTGLSPQVFLVALGSVMFTTGATYAVLASGAQLNGYPVRIGLGIWWWQTAIAAWALFLIRRAPRERTSDLLRMRSPALWALTFFVIFNCLCPYLGLKSRSALAMHCNLRTEKGYWNHLFLPERMRVFGFQDDLVTIVESDLPDFEYLRERGMPLPFFEFRRWTRLAEPNFFVDYRDSSGELRRFEKVAGHGSDPALMEASPVLEKFLCFNPVGASHDYIPALVPRTGPARNVVPPLPRAEDSER